MSSATRAWRDRGRGARLQSWFERWDSYRRHPLELNLRRDPAGDVLVVAGQLDRYTTPQGEELFVVAFRRVREGPLGFLGRVALLPALAAAVLALCARRLRAKP